MGNERQQPDPDRETPPVVPMPSDGEIFGTPFFPEPAQDDIFAPPVEFASAPDPFDAPGFVPTAPRRELSRLHLSAVPNAIRHLRGLGRLSRVQKILIAGIVAIAATLVYVLVARTPAPSPDRRVAAQPPSEAQAPPQQAGMGMAVPARTVSPRPSAPAEAGESAAGDTQRMALPAAAFDPQPKTAELYAGTQVLPGPEPLSLQLADKLYLRRDFEPALVMYDKLYRRLPAAEENQPLRDFLLWRMALCHKNSGNVTQADTMLRTISLSRLPILRALARYHQSVTLLSRQRHLEAAVKAYQTVALIEVANYDKKWISAVQQQCHFLVAEAVTRKVLSLCDADANLPPELWSGHPDIDPFVEMDEPQLRVVLGSGVEPLEGTVLGPQIRRTGNDGTAPRWSVICNGAPIEELLARFAANTGVNLRWTGNGQAAGSPNAKDRVWEPAPAEDNVRARPIYLYLTSATAPQVVTTAAGSAGLIAQTDDKGTIRLLDPTFYSSLADHTGLLTEEAITLWQRFLLTSENDPRVTNAHFATALLQAARGQFDEAIAEYKLIANHFAKHALAPHALLQSGTLKVRLRDYVGAHADLKQLVELYPETELSDRAGLYLADATMKAGLYEEATGLYRKVYNLGLSVASQTESALGAGRCLYETQEYEDAAKWLTRYVTLARDQSQPGFSAACLLLGKAYLALHQPQPAQAALNLAIRGELSRQQHVEAVAVLVKTYIEQELFLEALGTLEGTSGWQLSQQETIELLLLRAQALRSIGLAHKAIVLLEEKGRYPPSPELQAKVSLELTRCYVEGGDLEVPRRILGQAFATAEPGPLADQIGRELAGVCLRLGQTAQAISVCSQLLERAPASARQSILALLADAYRHQGRYDQAVATMLDRYESIADPKAASLIRDN